MIEDSSTGRVASNDKRKESWSTPTLVRIEASEAETATRSGTDGPWTYS